jgi:hypothetical protein
MTSRLGLVSRQLRFGIASRTGNMRAKNVAAVAAVGLIAVVAAAPASAEVPDARCDAAPTATMADSRNGQTFTALNTGHLVRFEAAFNNLDPPSSWTVQIHTTDGTGKPTNTTLAEATVPVGTTSPGGTGSRTGGSFPNPAFVTAGTAYALVISAGGSNRPMSNGTNPCPGRVFGDDSLSGSWPFSYGSFDLVFATYVEPPEPQPQPAPKADGTLTIDANKGKVEKGRKVTLTGQLDVAANESCEPGRAVQIQRRLKSEDDSKFATFKTVTTDAAGNYSLRQKVRKTFFYRAVVGETEACDGETSNSQKVRAQKKKAAQEA